MAEVLLLFDLYFDSNEFNSITTNTIRGTNTTVIFISISCFLVSIGSHLMFNLMTASINSEASKSYKSLLEMYFKTNSLLNTRRKMNVIQNQNFIDSLNWNKFLLKFIYFFRF